MNKMQFTLNLKRNIYHSMYFPLCCNGHSKIWTQRPHHHKGSAGCIKLQISSLNLSGIILLTMQKDRINTCFNTQILWPELKGDWKLLVSNVYKVCFKNVIKWNHTRRENVTSFKKGRLSIFFQYKLCNMMLLLIWMSTSRSIASSLNL